VIVVINGHPRSGKDTAVAFLAGHLAGMGWASAALSTVDPVRSVLRDLGVPVDRKTNAERDLMAEVQGALEKYDRFATRACARKVRDWLWQFPAPQKVCFVHMREPAAIAKFRELLAGEGQVKTLYVERPGALRVETNTADAGVENMTYDLTISNDGTLDNLRLKCAALASQLTEEILYDDKYRHDHPAVA
jgi:hypothetical protein